MGLLFILFMRISYYGEMALGAAFVSSDEQQMYLERASAAGVAAVFVCFVAVVAIVGELITTFFLRRYNQRYERLGLYVEEYLKKYEDIPVSDENKAWIKKMMNRRSLIQCMLYLWMLIVLTAGDMLLVRALAGNISDMLLWTMLLVLPYPVVEYQVFVLRRKPVMLCEDENKPLDAIWCQYKKHDSKEVPARWSVYDMNIAVCMNRMHDHRESTELAEEIWKCFGRRRKKGTFYMQYHFLQWRNYQAMGSSEEAQIHKICVQKELERKPSGKYSRRVAEQLDQFEGEKDKKG